MQTTQTLLWKRHDGVCSACVCCRLQRLSGAPRRAASLVCGKKKLRCCAVILASPPNPNNSSAQQRNQPGNNLITRRWFNLSPRDGTGVGGGGQQQVLINSARTRLLVCASQTGHRLRSASGVVSSVPSEFVYTAGKSLQSHCSAC